jgi:protein required for attachment to host cells
MSWNRSISYLLTLIGFKQNLVEVEAELVQTREAEAAARQDLQHQRLTIDELSRKLGDLEVRHRQDVDSQRKLVQERDEMQSTARRTESAHSEETQRLRKELSSELERYKQLISDKEQVSLIA